MGVGGVSVVAESGGRKFKIWKWFCKNSKVNSDLGYKWNTRL